MTTPNEDARGAHGKIMRRAFGRPVTTSNAIRNAKAYSKMSRAERETGKTVEQLAEEQRAMKQEFLARQQRRAA